MTSFLLETILLNGRKKTILPPPLCKKKPQTLELVLRSSKTALGNGKYTLGHNRVLDELVRFMNNYLKSQQTRNLFQRGAKYTLALSKQSNIEQYPVKNFLDKMEIGRYLPTSLDGMRIISKQYFIRVCDQILFFCQRRSKNHRDRIINTTGKAGGAKPQV